MFSNLPLDTQLGSCTTEILPDFQPVVSPLLDGQMDIVGCLEMTGRYLAGVLNLKASNVQVGVPGSLGRQE